MIYNYTKCESVIAKVMADLDSSEVRLRITDIREWIFEAVDKIGAPMLYITKESGTDEVPIFPILDNQIPIPVDLVILDSVAYSNNPKGPWVPMNSSTAIFKEPKKHPKPHIHHSNPPHDPANKVFDDIDFIVPEHLAPAYKMMTSLSLFYNYSPTRYVDYLLTADPNTAPEYFIKPGWIVTNKKRGFIKLAYKAIATDERGYPLIPDLTSYLEAIYWYVVMKLTFPKFMSGKLGGKGVNSATNVYYYTQQLWNFYRNLAYAEAMMPTADNMRNIKNDWNRLIPDVEADDMFFKHINKEEITYNDYYHGY